MGKVLIVSYHAPPRETTAAFRVGALKDYLPEWGWEPTVVSAPMTKDGNLMAQLSRIKTRLGVYGEDSWVDRLAYLYGELFFYPDPMRKWADSLNLQGLYDELKPDLIMSHSFPHSSHLAVSKLHRRVPWIVSMGDLWTNSHYYPYSQFRRLWEQGLEHDTLSKARCFITVTPTLAKKLQEDYWQHVFTIENGYPETPDVPLTKEFTMTYTGNFYSGKYDLELFCWALKMHQHKFPELKVRFYGEVYPYLKYLVRCYRLDDMVQLMGVVSHSEALKAQKESHVLLHFAWNDPRYQGVYSAKLFEYLGAKRPIVSFGGADQLVGDLLESTCTGAWCDTPDRFGLVMQHLHRMFKDNIPTYHGLPEEVAKYSQRRMAERHAELFNRIIS